MQIDPREVVFDPASVADPNGSVFWWRGNIYRAVTEKAAGLYRTLFESGEIQNLFKVGLIETEITSLSIDGYELVLSHRTIPKRSYPFEWCNEMFRDAALVTCDLNLALLSLGLKTQDTHPWNIMFDGPIPIFIDFGSIVRGKSYSGQLSWPYGEFQDTFLYPMYLMSSGQGELARRLLSDLNNSPSKQSIIGLLPWPRRLQCKMKDLFNNPSRFETMESFLQQLRRDVEVIKFPVIKTAGVEYYEDDFPAFEPSQVWNPKDHTVFGLLKKLHPTSVVDINSNNGWYSQLAARMGIPVVALDSNESNVCSLYTAASNGKLPILPLVMDICDPSTACIGDAPYEYHPPADDRLKGEMVLALDIVHKMIFKQGLRFDGIVERLAGFTSRWLIVEFVPNSDGHVSERHSNDLAWYSAQAFQAELKKVFFRIEVQNSYPADRQLLLCER